MHSDEEVDGRIQSFLLQFEDQYAALGPLPLSFYGSLGDALNHSLFEPTSVKYLFFIYDKNAMCHFIHSLDHSSFIYTIVKA